MSKRRKKRVRKTKPPVVVESWLTKVLEIWETVSRKDALIRQLDTAIWLWFFERDALAIHVVAMAAYQCLCNLHGKEMDLPDGAYAWLRHGSSNREEQISFAASDNAKVLWNATMLFFETFGGFSPYMRAFRLYYLLRFDSPMQWNYDHIALYLPEGLSIDDVHGWNRLEFFRKVTKRFVAEDARKVAQKAGLPALIFGTP